MKHKKHLTIIVLALLLLNIFDGSFRSPSLLDWVKLPLFALCLFFLLRKGGDS
jgi:Na+/glutamate symporter